MPIHFGWLGVEGFVFVDTLIILEVPIGRIGALLIALSFFAFYFRGGKTTLQLRGHTSTEGGTTACGDSLVFGSCILPMLFATLDYCLYAGVTQTLFYQSVTCSIQMLLTYGLNSKRGNSLVATAAILILSVYSCNFLFGVPLLLGACTAAVQRLIMQIFTSPHLPWAGFSEATIISTGAAIAVCHSFTSLLLTGPATHAANLVALGVVCAVLAAVVPIVCRRMCLGNITHAVMFGVVALFGVVCFFVPLGTPANPVVSDTKFDDILSRVMLNEEVTSWFGRDPHLPSGVWLLWKGFGSNLDLVLVWALALPACVVVANFVVRMHELVCLARRIETETFNWMRTASRSYASVLLDPQPDTSDARKKILKCKDETWSRILIHPGFTSMPPAPTPANPVATLMHSFDCMILKFARAAFMQFATKGYSNDPSNPPPPPPTTVKGITWGPYRPLDHPIWDALHDIRRKVFHVGLGLVFLATLPLVPIVDPVRAAPRLGFLLLATSLTCLIFIIVEVYRAACLVPLDFSKHPLILDDKKTLDSRHDIALGGANHAASNFGDGLSATINSILTAAGTDGDVSGPSQGSGGKKKGGKKGANSNVHASTSNSTNLAPAGPPPINPLTAQVTGGLIGGVLAGGEGRHLLEKSEARVAAPAKALTAWLAPFVDRRDGSGVISTHIYLLMGVSLPLWISHVCMSDVRHVSTHVPTEYFPAPPAPLVWSVSWMASYIGAALLCFGDTFASFVGRANKGTAHVWWPRSSNKTYIGSAAFTVASLVFMLACHLLSNPTFAQTVSAWSPFSPSNDPTPVDPSFYPTSPAAQLEIFRVVAAVTACALLEAQDRGIDNLHLPLFGLTVALAFKAVPILRIPGSWL